MNRTPLPTPRRTLRLTLAGLALASTAALAPLAAPPASAMGSPHVNVTTVRASIDGRGGQLTGNTYTPQLSSTGRFLAFSNTGAHGVFVEDLLSGQSILASIGSKGAPSTQTGGPVGVSTDGNRITFTSDESALAPGAHTTTDLYVRDRQAGTTTRVNIGTAGVPTAVSYGQASVDDTATHVTWQTADGKVWYRNLLTKQTQRVDVSSGGMGASSGSLDSQVSGDGTHVVFSSYAGNLVAGDTNNWQDVFVRTIATAKTVRASLSDADQQLLEDSHEPSISDDGRYVAFVTAAADAVAVDTNNADDVFIRDLTSNTTKLASLGTSGVQGNFHADDAQISGDGFSVIWRSPSTNLVPTPTTGQHFWKRDLFQAKTELVDQNGTYQPANVGVDGSDPAIDADGGTVAFFSNATNLVPSDTNGSTDVFVRLPQQFGPVANFQAYAQTIVSEFDATLHVGDDPEGDIAAGRVTPTHLIAVYAHRADWAKDREPVGRLYDAFFDRAPDLSGLNHWVKKHQTGTNLNAIATEFAKSNEFRTHYGQLGNADFVKLVYEGVLKRPADAAGLAHWTDQLDKGVSRGAVMVQFSESAEGKRHLAAHVDSVLIGLGMLGRIPNVKEFPAAIAAAVNGKGALDESIARYFLTSPAYLARF